MSNVVDIRRLKVKVNHVSMASNDKVHTKFLQYQSLVPNVGRGNIYRQTDIQTAPFPHYPASFR